MQRYATDMKSDLMEIYGIYLSTREKRLCLKADQASSGSIQSRITSQCMLPNSLFIYIYIFKNGILPSSPFTK